MSNSSLVVHKNLSPNNSGKRTAAIDRITPHCVVGQCSAESLGAWFAQKSAEASSNYGIDKDGRVGMYVIEANIAWSTSSRANDKRAVTIEVASDTKDPYRMNDVAYEKLIELCIDICKRNKKTKLIWWPDREKTLSYTPAKNEMVLTVHRWFANKACVPTYSEVLTRKGWKRIDEVQIGEEIACADLDNLNISFEEVYDKVPIRHQDTYTNNELTATMDHRMIYRKQNQNEYRIDHYKQLLSRKDLVYIPLAGRSNFDGLPLCDAALKLLVAIQADGHYMRDRLADGNSSEPYGIEFHLNKERKVERITKILDKCKFDWTESKKADGSVSIRVYNTKEFRPVQDFCEKFLHNKHFTWRWLYLSPRQADIFLKEILYWDGCEAADSYTSSERINLDVVNAIAAINGKGSRVSGSNVQFRDKPFITLSNEENGTVRHTRQHEGRHTEVTCVSVKTGIFLMRQNGKTFIVGNCPGDWLYSRLNDLATKVNANLNSGQAEAPTPAKPEEDKPFEYKKRETIRLNSRGKDVLYLQKCLNKLGYKLAEDSLFGMKTYAALRNYQSSKALDVDGICGPKSWASINAAVSLTLAKEVIHGMWGNQPDRQRRLEAAGFEYEPIKEQVDILMGKK